MMRISFDKIRFARRVKRVMELQRMSWDTLKARSGISHGTLSRILSGDVKGLEAILSVAAALDIDISDFLEDHGNTTVRRRDRILV